jgi:hypothetical protein
MTPEQAAAWGRAISASKSRTETLTIFHRMRQAHGDDDPRVQDFGASLVTGGDAKPEEISAPLTPHE